MKKILFTSLIPLNSFLLIFLLFEHRLVIPPLLQVAGRMHPVVLHFPIVLFLLFSVLILFVSRQYRTQPLFEDFLRYLLLVAALASVVSALMGFFLSHGGDYPSETFKWHKWTGVMIPFLLFGACAFYEHRKFTLFFLRIFSLSVCALIIVAGHNGATLTHGENFLLEPVYKEPEKKLPPFDEALVYADLVKPIFDEKCMSCHNSDKAKGEFVMETKELLLKGGKDGKPWDTSRADLGLMMTRVHLPLKNKKHMPPSGKPQLMMEEIATLEGWIRAGAAFDKKITDLAATDTLYLIAKKIFGSASEEIYTFEAADEKIIRDLNNDNRIIAPIAIGSPALSVSFFNPGSFKDKAVEELIALKNNITEMNFTNMPLSDESMGLLKQFTELRKLNLNFTAISGAGLASLTALPALKHLSLSGTSVENSALSVIENFPSLRHIYLWNTNVDRKDIADLEKLNKKVLINYGFTGDTTILQLTPPVFAAEGDVFNQTMRVNLNHSIQGVSIRYTLDGREPDSLSSHEYTGPIVLEQNTMIRAKAFKKGWVGSDVARHYYFKQTYQPDSAVVINKNKSAGSKAYMLIDNEKSDINFTSGRWLIFGGSPMESYLFFKKPVSVSNLTLSILLDISANIMPPEEVAVWGGPDASRLKLLKKIKPVQPEKMEYREILPVECNFSPTEMRVIKIQAHPLSKMPDWHQNKGGSARLFVDEVFVN